MVEHMDSMTSISFVYLVPSTIFVLLVVRRRRLMDRVRLGILVSTIRMNCRNLLNQSCRVAMNVECVLASTVAQVALASSVAFVAAHVWNAVFTSVSLIACRRIHMKQISMMIAFSFVLRCFLHCRCPSALAYSCKLFFFAVQRMGLHMQISRCSSLLLINTVPL